MGTWRDPNMMKFRTELDRMIEISDTNKSDIRQLQHELSNLQDQWTSNLKKWMDMPKENRHAIKMKIDEIDARIQKKIEEHRLNPSIEERQKLKEDICEFIYKLQRMYAGWIRDSLNCSNDGVMTGEDFEELGFGELIVIPGNDDNIWCFSCNELAMLRAGSTAGSVLNPYDRSDIPGDILKKARDIEVLTR